MIVITFKYRYRKQIIISLLGLIIISTIVVLIVLNKDTKSTKENNEIKINTKELKKEEPTKEKIEYKVDIKGQINNPGIYTLDSNSRIIDVIEKAGGLTEHADTSVINLSKKINDEMVIIIYSYDEVKEFEKTKEKEEIIQSKCRENEIYSIKNEACISNVEEVEPTNNKISLNTATKEELMTLPGIGESKANEIINYRNKNGEFKSIEDIKNISGIGDSIFAQIKENITT